MAIDITAKEVDVFRPDFKHYFSLRLWSFYLRHQFSTYNCCYMQHRVADIRDVRFACETACDAALSYFE